MTRQDINKFRIWPDKRGINKPRNPMKLKYLWNVVFSGRYDLPAPEQPEPVDAELKALTGPHGFFHASLKFFDVHQHRNTRAEIDILGRFAFYSFSEIFHKFSAEIPRAVVVGQWDIALVDGAFCIKEQQDYDGSLGRRRREDVYSGYCLPKGRNLCFLMREAKAETPKFYILEAEFDDPHTFQVHILSGHMLKGSRTRKLFHSPVYAVRVDGPVERNILRCEDAPQDIMKELEVLERRYSHL